MYRVNFTLELLRSNKDIFEDLLIKNKLYNYDTKF